MLKEIIDKYYQDKRDERDKKRFYVSDAGKCPRQIFFKFKKAPHKEIEPRLLRIFDQGDYVHLRLMRDLFSLGIVVASEIDIPPQEDIGGRADAIIRINNELYLVDFKSINSNILQRMDAPKEDHVLQVQLYLHFFKLKKGILLYEGKDNSEIKEFPVEYDEEKVKKVLNDFKRLKINVERNLVPKRLPDYPKNWQCQYCQFREVCDLAGEGNIQWEEFKKKIEEAGKKQNE
ncbi:PD-(D/E)XK nuclease family protein [bacterium]|nr:PD-(D/E)XK nuclease family protein [bacterium]